MTPQQLEDFTEKFSFKDKSGRYPEMWGVGVTPQDVIKWIESLETGDAQVTLDYLLRDNS